MELDDYQKAWKSNSGQMRVTINKELLSQTLNRSRSEFRSTIFWRDVRETGTSLVMIPIWISMGIVMSLPWTWYLTVPALAWVAGFVLIDRHRHPRRSSEPGEPLVYYVKGALAEVEHQIWLLRNVFWWYLLPFCLSIMAFFLQVAWETSGGWWGFVLSVVFSSLFIVVVYGWVFRLNQRAVREHLEPRRAELAKLVTSLEDVEMPSDNCDHVIGIETALVGTVHDCGLNSGWVEYWDLLIPAWRHALAILLPTLAGGLCGLCSGLWLRIPEMGPVFFQTTVGAVLPFEVALFYAVWRERKGKRQTPAAHAQVESNARAAERRRLPRGPALLIFVLTLMLGVLAVLAILSFMSFVNARALAD